jgi:predicted DNA-binding antitoxin AbrB/MazE fold protein
MKAVIRAIYDIGIFKLTAVLQPVEKLVNKLVTPL